MDCQEIGRIRTPRSILCQWAWTDFTSRKNGNLSPSKDLTDSRYSLSAYLEERRRVISSPRTRLQRCKGKKVLGLSNGSTTANLSASGEVMRKRARRSRIQLGSAVFISDLATELQIGFPKLQEWIRSAVIESGHGSLDEGHWPTATERQQAAAIEHLGCRRLLIRF